MNNRIIVSRHPAAVEFIARELGGSVYDVPGGSSALGHRVLVDTLTPERRREIEDRAEAHGDEFHGGIEVIPILDEAAADDVRGKVVYGNLPLHLAAVADCVHAIEFSGSAPRGAEYSLADMVSAGAKLVSYGVLSLPAGTTLCQYLNQGGFSI